MCSCGISTVTKTVSFGIPSSPTATLRIADKGCYISGDAIVMNIQDNPSYCNSKIVFEVKVNGKVIKKGEGTADGKLTASAELPGDVICFIVKSVNDCGESPATTYCYTVVESCDDDPHDKGVRKMK